MRRQLRHDLPADSRSVGTARVVAGDALKILGVSEGDRASAVLVISELVTNAVVHSEPRHPRTGPPGKLGSVGLRFTLRSNGVLITVSNTGTAGPDFSMTAEDYDEHHRGGMIIIALCGGRRPKVTPRLGRLLTGTLKVRCVMPLSDAA